jgi:hypothetical protein
MKDAVSLKKALYDQCLSYVRERLDNIQSAISSARESANDDSKSSAGDKHETGRAMAQLEQEKLSTQLFENEKLQQTLNSVDPAKTGTVITPGSLVITDKGNYYIAISAGKIIIDKEIYFAVSAVSPIGKELILCRDKRQFSFNGQNYLIKKVL